VHAWTSRTSIGVPSVRAVHADPSAHAWTSRTSIGVPSLRAVHADPSAHAWTSRTSIGVPSVRAVHDDPSAHPWTSRTLIRPPCLGLLVLNRKVYAGTYWTVAVNLRPLNAWTSWTSIPNLLKTQHTIQGTERFDIQKAVQNVSKNPSTPHAANTLTSRTFISNHDQN
jgi:hypothetical protein